MARGRVRKTDRGSFTKDQMRNAVQDVIRGGYSVREAARTHGLKFQTVARYVKKQKENPGETIGLIPRYDCRKVFSEEQELLLEDYVLKCSKMCYGQTTFNVRTLAYEMGIVNNIEIPETWKRDKKAGLEWLHGFFKRHPRVSIRRPENCSLSRMTAFNRSNVETFFTNLRTILERNPEHFKDGSRIFNLDETATTTVQRCQKIIAQKGVKQVTKAVSAERGTLVTTCCIISAAGNALPPAMIFPRKKFNPRMIQNAMPGTLGLVSNSGWMTSELFPSVMRHFIKFSHSSKENSSLLIFDNHESHISVEAINIAKENGVSILTLPPHCSHKIQPLDVAVFFPFKSFYNAAVDAWMVSNPGKTVSIYEIAGFVATAHDRAMTPSNIKSGFKKAGIFPFDDEIFSDQDFLSSSVTDREEVVNHSSASSLNIHEETIPHPNGVPDQLHSPSSSSDVAVQPITPRSALNPSQKQNFLSPEQFKGFPKAGPRKVVNRKRKRGRSFIPTDTPEKLSLENAELEKLSRLKKKAATSVKKKVFSANDDDDSSESSSIDEFSNSGSSDEYDVNEEIENLLDERKWDEAEKPLMIGDYALVKFSANRNTIYYIGEVLGIENEEVEFKFLRKSSKNGKFFYPNVDDISTIKKEDIVILLPTPKSTGTSRQQKYLAFEVEFSSLEVR